jgi:hypothetical protein
MLKKFMMLIVGGLLVINLSGCFALFAGVAGGAGTAAWLSGKLTQDFNSTYEDTVQAAKAAVRDLNLNSTKETVNTDVAQLRGTYSDGKEYWIDVRSVTPNTSKVEVRVGAVNPDKEAASAILKKIEARL